MTSNAMEAEQAVVGSILIDARCLSVVEELLRPEDMAMAANRSIYEAAIRLRNRGEALDPVLILKETAKQGKAVEREYLLQLMDTTPTAANVKIYAELTREASLRRGIAALAEEMRTQAGGINDPQNILAEFMARAEDLQQEGTDKGLLTPMEQASRFYDHLDKLEYGQSSVFVPTGFRDVDNILGGGMLSGGMYILAARPGMGKTTLAINIAERVAKKVGGVLFISLEMDSEQLTAKRISSETGIPANKLLMQKKNDEEYQKIADALEKQNKVPLYINARASETVSSIEALARKVPSLRLIVIDYLGKISPGDRGRLSRYEYTTEISGDLKTMARRFKIPVLVLAQLNRESEKRMDKRPNLADLRDTGAAEQDADGVIFLYRQAYYGDHFDKDPHAPEETDVIVAKNRHAGTGECQLAMYPATSRFRTTNNDPRHAYRQTVKAGNE